MSIPSFLLAVVVLVVGATLLWFLSEMIAGKQEFILHFGAILGVTLVGMILFPFFGWKSTGLVLAGFGSLWIISNLIARWR